MRILTIAALVFAVAIPMHPQQKTKSSSSGRKCGPPVDDMPYDYMEATLEQIEPPDWRHELIRISVGTETKLDLWTDGQKFKLWTTSNSYADVEKMLLDLNRACRLPVEAHQAVPLLKIKWESADLTPAQFSQIHQDFTNALSQYISSAQARYKPIMETNMHAIFLDTANFRIVYDNSYEHIEAEVWNDPKIGNSLLKWIDQLHKLAEDTFHHPFAPKINQ